MCIYIYISYIYYNITYIFLNDIIINKAEVDSSATHLANLTASIFYFVDFNIIPQTEI